MKSLWQQRQRVIVGVIIAALGLVVTTCNAPLIPLEQNLQTAATGTAVAPPADTPTPTASKRVVSSPPEGNTAIPVGITEEGHPYRGYPDAPVTIEEFSDFQCPFCLRHFQQTEPLLLEKYVRTGQVRIIFYDFPIDSIHPQARMAAKYARCAGQQSATAFWAMHDRLFAGQNEWSGNPSAEEVFLRYAGELNLDMDVLKACLASEAIDAGIQADIVEGQQRGVGGTPNFFLTNGWYINGAHPFERFQEAIEAALAGQSPTPTPTLSPAQARPWAPDPDRPGLNYNGTHYIGSPDAPYTIIEASDFQCPYCLSHTEGPWLDIKKEYVDTGKIRFVFVHLLGHTHSLKAAETAECAGLQGRFWEMHDLLFEKSEEWWPTQNPVPFFKGYAEALGLDSEAFNTCLDAGQTTQAILNLHSLLLSGGVRATPSFIIIETAQLLQGSPPFEQWKEFLDRLIGD